MNIYDPPSGAREWLTACFMRALETIPDGARGPWALIGALEAHACLTQEQTGRLNHWLLPNQYDEQGNRKPLAESDSNDEREP